MDLQSVPTATGGAPDGCDWSRTLAIARSWVVVGAAQPPLLRQHAQLWVGSRARFTWDTHPRPTPGPQRNIAGVVRTLRRMLHTECP